MYNVVFSTSVCGVPIYVYKNVRELMACFICAGGTHGFMYCCTLKVPGKAND